MPEVDNSPDVVDIENRERIVHGFLKGHSLDQNVRPIAVVIEPAIYWANATLRLVQLGFANANEVVLNDPTAGLLLNLLNRNFEAVDGAIVAFLSECGPTSEISSRAAIELSASVMYILEGDRRVRLLAYFDDYIAEGRRQVKQWREIIVDVPVTARPEHYRAVALREQAIEAFSLIVEQIRVNFDVDAHREVWPNIAGRFRAIGAVDHYRTVYARLSSQTHSDAEETLRYFGGVMSGSEELMEKMGIETVEYTRMMLLFAVSDFVKASALFTIVNE